MIMFLKLFLETISLLCIEYSFCLFSNVKISSLVSRDHLGCDLFSFWIPLKVVGRKRDSSACA